MNRVTATMLLDYYGDLLTEKQRSMFDLYYNQDLNFAEIAELEGISRQGVRDAVTRTADALGTYEEKTGYVARDLQLKKIFREIRGAAVKIQRLGGEGAEYAKTILDALGSVSGDPDKETVYGI